jgi:hypothetical protein
MKGYAVNYIESKERLLDAILKLQRPDPNKL